MRARLAFLLPLLALSTFTLRAQTTTWPRQIPSPAGTITIYQPQIDTYSGNQLGAHAAVSVAQTAGGEPTFGAIFFTATVATDRDTDLVTIENIDVTNSHFPSAAQETAAAVSQAITQAGDQGEVVLSQSQLVAQLALTQKEQGAAADLNNTPPNILFESQPSVLVLIDGEPKLTQAANSPLLTVVNTPFFIALDPAARTYYLHGGGQWLSTSNIMQGPWSPAATVPAAVSTLAATQSAGQTETAGTGTTPQVVVATQPTELIQTTGPAEYGPIDNTNLLYVTNTGSDVFMDIDTQSLYVLLSGRWFTAPSQAGPWTYVAPAQLPSDFSHIPAGLPISNVLASIPNTQAAQNAVLDAQIPQTAAIQRKAAGPKVTYEGAPKFQPVATTSTVAYAVNTSDSVVQVEDSYYVCSDGVWYQGSAAVGPWIVSTTVPQIVYTIPPTCPIYPVTFCRIYSATADVVYCGYLPGYTGSYVFGGTVVYGTGWPYDPWYGTAFIPRPVTWGFGATFSAGYGSWGFGVGAGWGAASFGCSWHSGWWGSSNNHWNNWNWNSDWNRNVNINRNVTNNVTNNFNHTDINRTTNNIYRNHPDRLTTDEQQRLDTNRNHLRDDQAHQQAEINHDRAAGSAAASSQHDKNEQQQKRDQAQRDADQHEFNENHPNHAEPQPKEPAPALNSQKDQTHDGDSGDHRSQNPAPSEHSHDDVYAGHDGSVYRHDDSQGWQQRQGDNWKKPSDNDQSFSQNRGDLNRQFGARARGGNGRR